TCGTTTGAGPSGATRCAFRSRRASRDYTPVAMDRQTQIEILLDHFNNPRNKKKLANADVDLPGGNPGCGDVVRIYLNVDADQDPTRIGEVAFEGSGCTISQAAASILMEMINEERPSLEHVLEMDFEDMVDV